MRGFHVLAFLGLIAAVSFTCSEAGSHAITPSPTQAPMTLAPTMQTPTTAATVPSINTGQVLNNPPTNSAAVTAVVNVVAAILAFFGFF